MDRSAVERVSGLIKSIIAPLIFGTLVYGIAGTGSVKTMGRIGVKAILYFEVLTTIALFLGLGAVNLVRPGEGMKLERSAAEPAVPLAGPTFSGTLEHTFPASVIDAMAKGDVLQIVVFSFLFGAACATIGAKAATRGGILQIAFGSDVPLHKVRDVSGARSESAQLWRAPSAAKAWAFCLDSGSSSLTLYGTLLIFVFVIWARSR